MSLVIDNDELLRMAEEVAASRGVSVTELVEGALRKVCDEEWETKKRKVGRLLQITREFRKGLPDGMHSSDHNDLYGDDGLPR